MRKLAACIVLLGLCGMSSFAEAAAPDIRQMAGAMLMMGFRGTTAPESVRQAVQRGELGGIILFDRDAKTGGRRNVESPAQVKALLGDLQRIAPYPLFTAIDQEGGKVRRLKPERGFFDLPSAETMGTMDEETVYQLGLRAGREMAELGINVDLAPVVDVRRSQKSPGLGDLGRLFSADPERTAAYGRAFSHGLMQAGVIPVLKHFPGLGSADKDSHHALPDVTKHWDERELVPYEQAFREGFWGMVLVAHVYHRGLDEQLPSSLSSSVIQGLLRNRLDWQGLVISDDLQMGAVAEGYSLKDIIRRAIAAGNDILLFGNNLEFDENLHERVLAIMLDLVRQGDVSRERLEQSWNRMEKTRAMLRR